MSQFVWAYHGRLLGRVFTSLEAAVAHRTPALYEPQSYTIVEVKNRRKVAFFDLDGNPVSRKASYYSAIPKKKWTCWNGSTIVEVPVL